MQRVVVIGNSGGGKSTLARTIAARHDLPHIEIDAFMWRPDWTLVPGEVYAAEHQRLIAGERWVIGGLGWRDSIAAIGSGCRRSGASLRPKRRAASGCGG